MRMHGLRSIRWRLTLLVGLVLLGASVPGWAQERGRDVPYVPTPEPVVLEMLRLAGVTKDDVVYDLGSGDGRIVIAAAQHFGARGVGIDIDPDRIAESTANAKRAGVADRVTFRRQDLFEADIREATVVTMYLLSEVNLRLRPKLLRELRPGTRIVSHAFDMGDWAPERVVETRGPNSLHTLYRWVVPAAAKGASGWLDADSDRTARADATRPHPRTPWLGTTKELGTRTRAPATAVRLRLERGRLHLDVPDVSELGDMRPPWDELSG